MKKKLLTLSLMGLLLISAFLTLPSFATDEPAKILKLNSGADKINFKLDNTAEEEVANIDKVDTSNYDVIMTKKEFLGNGKVKAKLKEAVLKGKQVLVVGNSLKEADVLNEFDLKSPAEVHINKGEYVLNSKITDDKAARIKNFYETANPEEKAFSVVGVGLLHVKDKIVHTSLIPDGLSDEAVNTLLKDIVGDSLGKIRLNTFASMPVAWALTDTPSGSVLKKSYSYYNYAYNPSDVVMFKYQRTGKLYRETNETDATYNYYWLATSDILSSGDYLYNNSYEMDAYLVKNEPYNGSGQVVLERSPSDQSTSGTVGVSLNLTGVTVSWEYNTGGSTGIMTDGGNGYTYTTWMAYPGGVRLWLPSKFTFETGMEFKVLDSDSSFEARSSINVDVERDLTLEGTYYDGDSLSITDN